MSIHELICSKLNSQKLFTTVHNSIILDKIYRLLIKRITIKFTIRYSQEVVLPAQIAFNDVFLHVHTHQLRKFIGVLEASRDFDGALPVVVVKALLVREVYQCFLRHLGCVVSHAVAGWGRSPLGYLMGCQMEIITVFP